MDATATRAGYAFRTTEHLRISDLDVNGHVNNVSVLTMVENARVRFLEDRTPLVRNDARTFMLVHIAIDYLGQLHYPGSVEAGCRLCAIGRSTVTLDQAIFAGDRPTLIARAVVANVDRQAGKALAFTPEERIRLNSLMPQG
jgi:acyl-CoA thioester hydrolase